MAANRDYAAQVRTVFAERFPRASNLRARNAQNAQSSAERPGKINIRKRTRRDKPKRYTAGGRVSKRHNSAAGVSVKEIV